MLREAAEEMAEDLAGAGLSINFERRIINTLFAGIYCFPKGFSKKDCIWIIETAIRAVNKVSRAPEHAVESDEPQA